MHVERTTFKARPDASTPAPAGSLQGDDMDGDPFSGLADRIHEVMEEKKPFLKEDFSLEDLATLLDVPKHHLYYSFRNILQTRFTSLRTEFRITYAKKILLEADLRMITLDALGKKCGFASRSAFYKTFKQEVGCSPGEYLERFRNNDGMGTPLQ
jgi:AraC-like DNA-binding protein